ncbi:SGNH/GDSL hydrolase family protein [uncultured Friedmanniella sp.]|uniref:SGNH/GDSL hydrolase family protein n=1 Tax=uncultured Friedmanniella sp. TaxID=335381 RepID=UPI0035CAAEAD
MAAHVRWPGVRLTVVWSLLAGLISCSATPTGAPAAADPLAHWRTALAGRGSSPAVWVAVGDSITEGQGASLQSRRWIDQTATQLRNYSSAGDVGYLPGWAAVFPPDSRWQPYASRSGSISNDSAGPLGLRTATMAAGATQTYRLTGTSVDLYYLRGGGSLSYAVDGGTATTIDTAGTVGETRRRRVRFGAAGAHELVISARSGRVRLAGVAIFDGDEASGVHLFDSAHSGYTSTQFVAAQPQLNPVLRLVAPDLVTIELGTNDYLRASASPQQVQANLRQLVTGLRTALPDRTPSIVLVLPYRIGPGSSDADYHWDDYVAATTALGTELGVGILDMSSMGTSAPGGSWASDGLHASDAGNAEMARRAVAYLGG